MSKIHWSTQTFPEFACEKKRRRYRRTARHNSQYRLRSLSQSMPTVRTTFVPSARGLPRNKVGSRFSAAEVEQLRALAEYVSRGFVGVEARKGLDVLKGKLS